MSDRAFDIATDYLPHFRGVKRLINIIVCAQPERLLRGLERTETGKHNYGKVRIDLPDLAQAINAIGARHTDVHDDCIGCVFLQQLQPQLHIISRVNLIIGF